jgi:hypothetical protein
MFGKWKIAIGLVLVVACAAVPAGAAGASPRITVLKVFVTGGDPPSINRVGEVSRTHGELRDAAGNLIGSWRLTCTYFGGSGLNGVTSHFCKHVATFGAKGSIFSEGGIAWSSGGTQWAVITGGTGSFRGVFGTVKISGVNTPSTPSQYFLIRQ